MSWLRFLPRASAEYRGPWAALTYLALIAVASTARSLVHMLAPDGGAGIIAGVALDVAGGPNIVAMFGQWGVSQLVLAVLYWLVILRYRFLVPFALGLVCLEQALRIGVGQLKPLDVAAPPPGKSAASSSCRYPWSPWRYRCATHRGSSDLRRHRADGLCGVIATKRI